MLKLCRINACSDGTLGLHLSRAPWDPYPWVSGIQDTSSAYVAGVRTGDTVLEVNGFDVIGQKISELAVIIRTHWNSGANHIQFLVWRCKTEQNTVNQQSLQKFATCLQNIAQLLECPICLEVVKPPGWQCCNGHVLCNSCRARTTKCSICRVTLGPRGRSLLSDKLFTLLAETFPCDVKKQNTAICNDQVITTPTRPTVTIKDIKRRKQITTIKVDFKPPQPKDCPCTVDVLYKNYHCPTGKSCVNPGSNVPCKMSNEWDVLTHLRRVHQLSVTQHYGTYGERMQVQLMNKSISCISVIPNGLHPATASSLSSQVLEMSPAATTTTTTEPPMLSASGNNNNCVVLDGVLSSSSNRRTSGTLGGLNGAVGKIADVELFFVARIPVIDGEGDGNVADGNERCSIFIWYCGGEEDVKKFQAVIECKRSGAKWKGPIQSLTKTWNSVQRQKEFLQLKFDVANSFDIVIKVK